MLRYLAAGADVVLDEGNTIKPECADVLHSLTDAAHQIQVPGYGLVQMHPHSAFTITMNEDYAGTNFMNEATIDRFTPIHIAEPETIVDVLRRVVPEASGASLNICDYVYCAIRDRIRSAGGLEPDAMTIRGFIDALRAEPLLGLRWGLLDNVASMLAGIKMHYERIGRKVNVVAFAGDGASVDAGMQCLSGAAERGDKIIYICYDNEGYMNTGYQRSGSTTKGAWTSTTPVINGHGGKKQNKKDFPMIMAMHDVPYMATMSPAYIPDMVRKLEKAMAVDNGLVYLHVYNPCVTGWGCKSDESIEVARLAVETNFAPLYEVENGVFKMSVDVKNPKPVKEFVTRFKKFRHLTEQDIEELQEFTDRRLARLKKLCGE